MAKAARTAAVTLTPASEARMQRIHQKLSDFALNRCLDHLCRWQGAAAQIPKIVGHDGQRPCLASAASTLCRSSVVVASPQTGRPSRSWYSIQSALPNKGWVIDPAIFGNGARTSKHTKLHQLTFLFRQGQGPAQSNCRGSGPKSGSHCRC